MQIYVVQYQMQLNICMKCSEQKVELNVDRTLETLIYLRAEGASVEHVKLSGKRTKITALAVYAFDGWCFTQAVIFYF